MNNSPYITSNWVEGNHFYGREALCTALITTNERCNYIMGIRRIGKTSLLKCLTRQMHPNAIYCDLMQAASQIAEQPTLDETRIIRLLRRELNRLDHEVIQSTKPTWDRNETDLVNWLEEASWIWEEQQITITLLWDEAEMLRWLPIPTLMRLRALLQHTASLRLMISASKGLAAINEQWSQDDASPFLFGFKIWYLAGLADDEADNLIRQRGAVQVSDSIADRIRALTGNHPFLLQTLCDRLYAQGTLRAPTEQDMIIDYLMSDLFRIDIAHLSPSEQMIVETLARQGHIPIYAIQEETELSEEIIHSLLHGLRDLGYLQTCPDGNWALGNEYLAQWIRTAPLLTTPAMSDQASIEVIGATPNQSRDDDEDANAILDTIPLLEEPLSEREQQVLSLLAQGKRNPEIAHHLTVSENTIKAHLKNIYRKLDVHERIHAVNRARELHLI